MPASILDLGRAHERTVTLVHDEQDGGYRPIHEDEEPDDQALRITYRPAAITVQFAKDYEAEGKRDPMAANARWLARVLRSWDLTDEKGQPYPITEEALLELGMDVLAMLFVAIIEDAGLGKAGSSSSSNGSGSSAGSAHTKGGGGSSAPSRRSTTKS